MTKKVIALILALLMILPLLFACGDTEEETKAPAESDTEPKSTEKETETEAETEEKKVSLSILSAGKTGYVAFAPRSDSIASEMLSELVSKFFQTTAVILRTTTSVSSSDGKEIILGKTDLDIDIDYDSIKGTDFIIRTKGERMFIYAETDVGYEKAFNYFFEVINSVEPGTSLSSVKELSISSPEVYIESAPPVSNNHSLESGVYYEVTGADSVNGNTFTVTDTLTYRFDKNFCADFNYFQLDYTASSELYLDVTYVNDHFIVSNRLFLEEDESTLGCLVDNFYRGTMGNSILEIKVSPMRHDIAVDFTLNDIKLIKRDISKAETIYVQNDKYKIGVSMKYGGALTYIEDLKDNIPGLSNLVNHADTGRLVQQSFYGTSEPPYVTGGWGGNTSGWPYNPVQGGDTNMNGGKVVDFKISDDGRSIYIKSIPFDWGKDAVIDPSYYENTYTLHNDYIHVDNRYTDYSDYIHPLHDQELPAFYVVAYLDTFVFYDGESAWTNDTLRVEPDLPFWSGPHYYFKTDENWCAWTDDNGYGIGLYSPVCTDCSAGRNYGSSGPIGTMNSSHGDCSYVSTQTDMTIVRFETIEYSYYVATGDVNDIRNVFKDQCR